MPVVLRVSVVVLCLLATGAPVFTTASHTLAPQAAAEAASSKTWLDRRQALEDYLKIAEVIKMEEIGLGVTKPRRAYLRAWRLGRSHGLEDDHAWHP